MRDLLFLMRRLGVLPKFSRSVRVMQGMILTGIALSVASLLISLGVAQGFEEGYKKGLLQFNAHVLIAPQEHQEVSQEKIRAVLNASSISDAVISKINPYLLRESLLIHDGAIRGLILKGVSQFQGEGIILGEAFAKNLGIHQKQGQKKGEMIKILIPQGKEITGKNVVRLPIRDFFKSGIYEIDSQFAMIGLKNLQKLFHLDKNYFGWEIQLHDPALAPAVAQVLQQGLSPLVTVQNWVELNAPLFGALELEKWAFRVLMGLMVLVSAIQLMGVVLFFVHRRQKMIALLQALGLRRNKIRLFFALQGFLLGGIGIAFGFVLAWGFLFALKYFFPIPIDETVYFLTQLPITFSGGQLFIIAGSVLLLIGIISWQSSKGVMKVSLREGLHGPGQ